MAPPAVPAEKAQCLLKLTLVTATAADGKIRILWSPLRQRMAKYAYFGHRYDSGWQNTPILVTAMAAGGFQSVGKLV
jgi:hypothetical protein